MRISWKAIDEVDAYRLAFVGPDGEIGEHSEESSQPFCDLTGAQCGGEATSTLVRLEVRRSGSADWEPLGPSVRVPSTASRSEAVKLRWEDRGPIHRLTVYDRTTASTIVDEAVLGSSFPFACPAEARGHDLAMRTRAWAADGWDEGTAWQPLPLHIVLGKRRQPPDPIEAAPAPGLLIPFTIDTECSVLRQRNPDHERVVDELIFGDYGNGTQHGIGLHMDLLEHFGYRGCFFLDVLMEHTFGPSAVERTVEAILARGHEIQLHLHPEHLGNSPDPVARRVFDDRRRPAISRFREALELGIELFERRTGQRPIAYRAGGYRIADEHFPLLEEAGILIDSSVHPYFNAKTSDWMRSRSQPFWVGGILEVPPSWILLKDDPQHWEPRAFAPNPSVGDPVTSLPPAGDSRPFVATYVSHSFQLLRASRDNSPKAIEAFGQRLRAKIPAQLAERMLTQLGSNMRTHDGDLDEASVAAVAGILRRVADRGDARCVTYAELASLRESLWGDGVTPAIDPIPALDRRRGIVSTVASQTRTRALLEHVSAGGETAVAADLTELRDAVPELRGGRVATIGSGGPDEISGERLDGLVWPAGFERIDATELGSRLGEVAALLRPEGVLALGIDVLGAGAVPPGAPSLAHLLFPSYLDSPVSAWDASTFSSWFRERGLEVVAERRRPLSAEGLANLDRQRGGLKGLDRREIEVSRLEVALRVPARGPAPAGVAAIDGTTPESVPLETLDLAATRLYASFEPGEERTIVLPSAGGLATETTVVLALMRAGLAVTGTAPDGARGALDVVRPLLLADIERIAGVG